MYAVLLNDRCLFGVVGGTHCVHTVSGMFK